MSKCNIECICLFWLNWNQFGPSGSVFVYEVIICSLIHENIIWMKIFDSKYTPMSTFMKCEGANKIDIR